MTNQLFKDGVNILLEPEKYSASDLEAISRFLDDIKVGVIRLRWAISERQYFDEMDAWDQKYRGEF